jgi:hypothetical protein
VTDGVGQGPGNDPVDVIEPVFQDRHADRHRQRRDREHAGRQRHPGGQAGAGVVSGLDGDQDANDAQGAAGHQPLQLLPPLPRGAPVADGLPGHEARPQCHDHEQGSPGDAVGVGQETSRVRVVHRRAGHIHPQVAHGEDGGLTDELVGHEHRAGGQVGPQHRAPAPGGKPAIREEQDRQPAQHGDQEGAGLGEHGHPAGRQRAGMGPVGQHRVQFSRREQQRQQAAGNQQPPDRVARLAAGDDQAQCREQQRAHRQDPAEAGGEVPGQGGEQHAHAEQQQHQPGRQHRAHAGRSPWRCLAVTAGRGSHPRPPGRVCVPHSRDVTGRPFRERYRPDRDLRSGGHGGPAQRGRGW